MPPQPKWLLVEKVAADSHNRTKFKDAVGTITPELSCFGTPGDSPNGAGQGCQMVPHVLAAEFTGSEPRPDGLD